MPGFIWDKSLTQTKLNLIFYMPVWHSFHTFKYKLFVNEILILQSGILWIAIKSILWNIKNSPLIACAKICKL